MNWSNLFWIFYAAAHTAAAIFDEVLELEMIGIRQAGPWAWVVPGVCLILLTLDLTGRLSLRGSGGKMLAALVLPLLCSCGEVLLWDDHIPERTAPAVCACVCSLLLLAAYALLRREEPKNPLAEAEALLEQGSVADGWRCYLYGHLWTVDFPDCWGIDYVPKRPSGLRRNERAPAGAAGPPPGPGIDLSSEPSGGKREGLP